ncbi:diphthamide synthesis protein [Chloropicon primus]|uniref:Diphthamide synthesis protein n=1 Tax=Chloropicon primus TaxID=1764295 RepID=A0A5B8MR54_9CHLO|nr:diphthamide synthesis protein [Chloropicon primus]UPR01705.1 diphthamide synthesis protein [Chloropicon primus]|eukprot:QDZ22484.1 diphthamide synthesis protein [Chloropicon primus]
MEAFEVEETVAWVRRNGKRRVALQVPDHLLQEAPKIAHAITKQRREEQNTKRDGGQEEEFTVFIMADTIDGSCHVDELTADHLTADCVVHYGATYIPEVAKLPVRFVLDKCEALEVEDLVDKLGSAFTVEEVSPSRMTVVLAYELKYEHKMGEVARRLEAALEGDGGNLKHTTFVVPRVCLKEQGGGAAASGGPGPAGGNVHRLGGLEWSVPSDAVANEVGEAPQGSVKYVWIGEDEDSLSLSNFMLVHNTVDWFRYDPVGRSWKEYGSVSTATRTLKRRYFLVEKAKDASIVGIVVGTLSIAGYLDALKALRGIIARAGKKSYTFVMGRITPEKLANFPEVEVFVLISCPQLALLDSREFYSPVITPFEAELAFVPGRSWTGTYTIGFDSLLQQADPADGGSEEGEEGGGPSFSLIKGGYRQDQRTSGTGVGQDIEINVIEPTQNLQLSLVGNREVAEVHSAADYMTKVRSYTGIETPQSGAEIKEPAAAVEGRFGRAAGYDEGRVQRTGE